MESAENVTYTINWTTYNIHLWVVPIICLAGLVGNLLCMVVCFNSRLRQIPSTLYLCALAAADSLYLLGQFSIWLPMVGLDTLSSHVSCSLIGFMLNVSSFLSGWSVTVFTFERFFVVHYPLQRARICTVYKAKCILVVLLIIAILLNLHTFFILESSAPFYCTPKEEHNLLNLIMNSVDTLLSYLVPLMAICIFNALIVRKLFKGKEENRESNAVELRRHGANRGSSQQEHKVTRMLLIVSTVFVLFNVISYSMRIKVQFLTVLKKEDYWSPLDQKLEFVGFLLNLSNYAIDFLLYNLSSKNFRNIATQVLQQKCKRSSVSSRVTTSTANTSV